MEQGGAFMIRLCSDKAAYEAIPKTRRRVDLRSLKHSLERRGDCEITLWTPQLMVVRQRDATEVTIVDDGRLVVRNVADQNAARRVVETFFSDLAVLDS